MNWRAMATRGLFSVVVIALVARVVWGLLGPLVPGLVTVMVLAALIGYVVRGPQSGGGSIHK